MQGVAELIVFESWIREASQRYLDSVIFRQADKVIVESVRISDDGRTRGAFILKLRSVALETPTEQIDPPPLKPERRSK